MKVETKKTVAVEMTQNEAFCIKSFLEQNVTIEDEETIKRQVQRLIDLLESNDI
jgi:hypothetical protein